MFTRPLSGKYAWYFFSIIGPWILMIIFLLTLPSCHQEDLNEYKIPSDEFVRSVVKEHYNQIAIAKDIAEYAEPELVPLANKRINVSNSHINEVTTLAGNPGLASDLIRTETDIDNLLKARLLDKDKRRLAFINLLIDSDERIIGLHVRAVSPMGVADESFRNWAERKLPQLRDNLKESQELK